MDSSKALVKLLEAVKQAYMAGALKSNGVGEESKERRFCVGNISYEGLVWYVTIKLECEEQK